MTEHGATVTIDGSMGEGGGAMVRAALALSAFTQRPLRFEQVRAGTEYPGLDVEDLVLIKAFAESCGAEAEGAEAGSSSFTFAPSTPPRSLNRTFDSGGAGRRPNALIVLHTLAAPLARSGAYSRVEVLGETFGHHALGFDAYVNVTCRAMRACGLYVYPEMLRAGFGREAKGLAALEVEPSALHGFEWPSRGRMLRCEGLLASASISQTIVQRGLAHLRQLAAHAGVPMQVRSEAVRSDGPGIHLTLWSEFERGFGSASCMGTRGLRVEALVQRAFAELMEFLGSDATTDPYLADQLLLPAVFSEAPCSYSTSRLTNRMLSTVWVAKQFLPIHLTVKGAEGSPGTISVRH